MIKGLIKKCVHYKEFLIIKQSL